MANHKATKKDTRQANKRRDRNRYQGKTTRNAMRDLASITSESDASAKLPKVIAMLDKLAKNNVIHRNKAANLKSAMAKKVNALANPVEKVVVRKAIKKATTTKKTTTKKAK